MRQRELHSAGYSLYFNPRTPRGGATWYPVQHFLVAAFQSTHPTRGCDSSLTLSSSLFIFQSTHPTRGCDQLFMGLVKSITISIHAPHEGVRRMQQVQSQQFTVFQSTHPTRGCDSNPGGGGVPQKNFNPRTPRGGATYSTNSTAQTTTFQSTHPTRGCDLVKKLTTTVKGLFQSTHPTRGCDLICAICSALIVFQSTHPTRGCDSRSTAATPAGNHFNPRTPRGGATHPKHLVPHQTELFQSTHPTRGCDLRKFKGFAVKKFQSTHPTRGCDDNRRRLDNA